MALAAAKTWNPGDVLTAADLNTLNTNILNNPISLVSPTTGAINFQTSVAHTNLQVSALTASSGFSGSVLVASTAATPSPVWSTGSVSGGIFVATTASIPTWLAIGTSGQFLAVTTSGTPAFRTGGSAIFEFDTGSVTVNSTAITTFVSGALNQNPFTVPFAGIASNLTVTADANPSASQTFVYTLRRNSANSILTATVTSSSNTARDTTDTVTFSAFDTADIALVLSSVGTNTAHRALIQYSQTS